MDLFVQLGGCRKQGLPHLQPGVMGAAAEPSERDVG